MPALCTPASVTSNGRRMRRASAEDFEMLLRAAL
jgi:hypothetical protein